MGMRGGLIRLRDGIRRMSDERGVVLVLVLLALLVLSAMAAALLSVAAFEPQIATNLMRGAQALALAEAGAERAIAQFVATPTLVSNAPAVCPAPAAATLTQKTGTATVTYSCNPPNLAATVLIESIGTTNVGGGQKIVRVLVTTNFVSKYAILAQNVEVGGNAKVSGNLGAVHGNASTEVDGSAFIEKTATSSAKECEGCTDAKHVGLPAASGGNKPIETIPDVSPLDFKGKADFILQDNKTILVVATGEVVAEGSGDFKGWKMQGAGQWRFTGNTTPPDGTYYASREIEIKASPGTADTPWKATFVAGSSSKDGEVEIEGHPNIVPFLDDVLIVASEVELKGTGGDASLSGAIIATAAPGGDPKAEVEIAGGVTFKGSIISKGEVELKGNASVIYDVPGRTGLTGPLRILSWAPVSK